MIVAPQVLAFWPFFYDNYAKPEVSSVQISILNTTGKILRTQLVGGPFRDDTLFFNENMATNLPAGLYLVQIQAEGEVQILKLLVQ